MRELWCNSLSAITDSGHASHEGNCASAADSDSAAVATADSALNSTSAFSADCEFAGRAWSRLRSDMETMQALESFTCATGIRLALIRPELPHVGDANCFFGCLCPCEVASGFPEKSVGYFPRVHPLVWKTAISSPEPVYFTCAKGIGFTGVPIWIHSEPIGLLALIRLHKRKGGAELSRGALSGIAKILGLGIGAQVHAYGMEKALPALLVRALRFIKSNYFDSSCSITQAAVETSSSRRQLTRLFRSHMNTTYSDALASYRVVLAMERLRRDLTPMKRIASEYGFGTVSSFSRAFRRITGLSAGEYRQGIEPARLPMRF